MRLFVLWCALFAAAASAASAAESPASSARAAAPGKISGRVTIAGLAPKLPPLPVTRDTKICGTNKPDEALVIGIGGGIKNAVIWLADVPAGKDAAPPKIRLDQHACRFEPRVAVVPVGATLEVVNSDTVLHHPKAQGGEKTAFSFPMPLKGHTVGKRLDKVETLRVTCESHPWMRAFVLVLDAGIYAVTDEQGAFTLPNVPAGKHKLKLWHERLGEREETVEVTSGETATRDLTLAPR